MVKEKSPVNLKRAGTGLNKASGYALLELEGVVYYMKYGTKKNAKFTNRR
jgi:hypothetical protein